MKSSIKKALATAALALTNVAVFAAGTNGSETSSNNGTIAVVFFAVLLGAIIVPALGHKAHH
jgi:hypothetical protein